MLSKNQWTEELPHNDDESGIDDSFAKFSHPFLPPADFTENVSFFSETKALAYIHHSEQIPSNHSTEVVVPPPDSAL